jgi:hypothetical protein
MLPTPKQLRVEKAIAAFIAANGYAPSGVLVPEAFLAGRDGVQIPAAAMRERLPEALAAVRARALYRWGEQGAIAGGNIAEVSKNFCDFVTLCERKEKDHGVPCTITANA